MSILFGTRNQQQLETFQVPSGCRLVSYYENQIPKSSRCDIPLWRAAKENESTFTAILLIHSVHRQRSAR